MSNHAVTLDEEHFRAAQEKARALGKTAEQYLQGLIDIDSRSFDEILEPVRRGFDHITEQEVDELLDRATKAARPRAHGARRPVSPSVGAE